MLEILVDDGDFLIVGFDDVFTVIWRRTPTLSLAVRLATAINAFAAQHAMSIAMLVVIEDGVPMPDAAVREKMARDMKKHESFTRAMALVFEAKGFMAATVRAVVAGMQMLSRQKVPTHVFATIEEAGSWLLRSAGAPSTRAAALADAVAKARPGSRGARAAG